jgi:fumarate reductase iron-sulfur subunit
MHADRDSENGHEATLQVDVWRGAEHGTYQRFAVPGSPNQTVLDVVTWIQRHLDTTLAYRFACRVGMCGSCAMTVNGRPRWTCRTHVQSVVKNRHLQIGPLRNLPVLRDLATDMAPFFHKWQGAQGRFSGTATRHQPVAVVCDVVKWRPTYLGPAALNRAWAGYNDVREADAQRILRAVEGDAGCYQCHSHQSCAEHCPVAVNPTRSIAALKRSALSLPSGK